MGESLGQTIPAHTTDMLLLSASLSFPSHCGPFYPVARPFPTVPTLLLLPPAESFFFFQIFVLGSRLSSPACIQMALLKAYSTLTIPSHHTKLVCHAPHSARECFQRPHEVTVLWVIKGFESDLHSPVVLPVSSGQSQLPSTTPTNGLESIRGRVRVTEQRNQGHFSADLCVPTHR